MSSHALESHHEDDTGTERLNNRERDRAKQGNWPKKHRQHHGESQNHQRGKPGRVDLTPPVPTEPMHIFSDISNGYSSIPMTDNKSQTIFPSSNPQSLQNQKENTHSEESLTDEISPSQPWIVDLTPTQTDTSAKSKVRNLIIFKGFML